MADPKRQELEEGFRSALKDCSAIIERLAPYCSGNVEELATSIALAVENDTQLRILMTLVYPQAKK